VTRLRLEAAIDRAALALARAAPVLVVAAMGIVLALTIVGPACEGAAPDLSRAIHGAFFISCHQIPERCLRIGPGIAPVCARCQAIYAGMLAAGLLALAGVPRRNIPFWLLCLLSVPMAADGVTQMVGWRTSTAALRLATGGLWGVSLGAFAMPLLREGFAEAHAMLAARRGAGGTQIS
jgi:uncharacterized membrane protein